MGTPFPCKNIYGNGVPMRSRTTTPLTAQMTSDKKSQRMSLGHNPLITLTRNILIVFFTLLTKPTVWIEIRNTLYRCASRFFLKSQAMDMEQHATDWIKEMMRNREITLHYGNGIKARKATTDKPTCSNWWHYRQKNTTRPMENPVWMARSVFNGFLVNERNKLYRLKERDSRLAHYFALLWCLGLRLGYLATSDAKFDVIFLLGDPNFL